MLNNTTRRPNPVRAAREKAGITQFQLALRTELSLSTVRNAERGIGSVHTFAAIARVLRVEVYALRVASAEAGAS